MHFRVRVNKVHFKGHFLRFGFQITITNQESGNNLIAHITLSVMI